MREEVTDMVLAGKTEQNIIRYYKAKYGETILVVPDGEAGQFAFGVPITVTLSAFGLLLFGIGRMLRGRTVHHSMSPTIPAANISPSILERIRRDLSEEIS